MEEWRGEGQSVGPFMEIKACVERILLDLHVSKKPLSCYIHPRAAADTFHWGFSNWNIWEQDVTQIQLNSHWLVVPHSQTFPVGFSLEFLHNYSPIQCGTAHPQIWEGCLESKPCYVQWILSSEQQIRGKTPFRKMKLKMDFQFSLLRCIVHLFPLFH